MTCCARSLTITEERLGRHSTCGRVFALLRIHYYYQRSDGVLSYLALQLNWPFPLPSHRPRDQIGRSRRVRWNEPLVYPFGINRDESQAPEAPVRAQQDVRCVRCSECVCVSLLRVVFSAFLLKARIDTNTNVSSVSTSETTPRRKNDTAERHIYLASVEKAKPQSANFVGACVLKRTLGRDVVHNCISEYSTSPAMSGLPNKVWSIKGTTSS